MGIRFGAPQRGKKSTGLTPLRQKKPTRYPYRWQRQHCWCATLLNKGLSNRQIKLRSRRPNSAFARCGLPASNVRVSLAGTSSAPNHGVRPAVWDAKSAASVAWIFSQRRKNSDSVAINAAFWWHDGLLGLGRLRKSRFSARGARSRLKNGYRTITKKIAAALAASKAWQPKEEKNENQAQ